MIILKKTLKFTCAICIATSSLLVSNFTSIHNHALVAQAATEKNYSIEGNTSDKGAFILEESFIDAVKNNRFVINGYKITGNEEQDQSIIDIYDQIIAKTSDSTASFVDFEVQKNTVSKDDIINKYGQPVEEPYESEQGFDYKYMLGKNVVQIIIKDGYVTDVRINAENE